MWEPYQMVWDGVRLAHYLQVAGSNPAPATNLVAGQEVGLLWTFEHGLVTDSAPTAAQVIVDGDEFKGGATVGPVNDQRHFEYPGSVADGLHSQRHLAAGNVLVDPRSRRCQCSAQNHA
jgi:hypothetical protein